MMARQSADNWASKTVATKAAQTVDWLAVMTVQRSVSRMVDHLVWMTAVEMGEMTASQTAGQTAVEMVEPTAFLMAHLSVGSRVSMMVATKVAKMVLMLDLLSASLMAVKKAAPLASMKAEHSVDRWDEALVVTMDATKVAPKAEHSALTSVVTKELTMVA